MAIGLSDGTHYEDDINYFMGRPDGYYDEKSDTWTSTEDLKKQQNLSQSGVKQPLRVTITPHMQAGESEQGSSEGGVFMAPDQLPEHRGPLDKPWTDSPGEMYNALRRGMPAGRGYPAILPYTHEEALKGVQRYYELNNELGIKTPLPDSNWSPEKYEEFQRKTPMSSLEDHKVLFVRHGETPENEPNEDGTLTIREKDAQLTDKGRKQSEQAAEKLKEEGVTDLFSSSLPRARESAEIIANKLGITPKFDSRLNTWGMGTLEGQPCTEDKTAEIKAHMKETPDKPLGGEESFNDFKDRTFAGIRDSVLNGTPGKTAVLTHSKVEDVFDRWKKTGQNNPSLDLDSPMKEEKPGSVEPVTIEANSTIMQPATYSKQQFAGGPGPTPQGDTPASRYFEQAGEETWQSIKSMFDRNHPENLISPGHLQGGGTALGIFTGRLNSLMRTFAETAEKRGISPEAIKRFLGAERGVEGMWRKEISDLGAYVKIPKDAFYDWPNTARTGRVGIRPEKFIPNSITEIGKKTGPFGNDEVIHRVPELRDIFEHPELYKAYPELANTPVERIPPFNKPLGTLSPNYKPDFEKGLLKFTGGVLSLNIPKIEAIAAQKGTTTSEEIKSVLLHEIQHWIQHKEGFTRGQLQSDVRNEIGKIYEEYWKNNPEAFTQYMKTYNKMFGDTRPTDYNEYVKAGYDMEQEGQYAAYLTQANEAESRNVQIRMKMSPEDIRRSLGKSTSDVPYRFQIIPAEPRGVTGKIGQTRLGKDYNKPNVPEPSKTFDVHSDEGMARLRELARQGKSAREMSPEFKVSERTIFRKMKSLGIEPGGFIGKKSRVPIEEIQKALDENMSWADIGRKFGMVEGAARQRAQRQGLVPDKIPKDAPDWFKEEMKQ